MAYSSPYSDPSPPPVPRMSKAPQEQSTAYSLHKELKSAPPIKWGDMSRATVDHVERRAKLIAELVRDYPNHRGTPKYARERWRMMMHYPMAFVPWEGPLGNEFHRLMMADPDAGNGRNFRHRLAAAETATESLVSAETEEVIARAPGSPLAAQAYMPRAICQVAPFTRGARGEATKACDAIVDLLRHLGSQRDGQGLRRLLPDWSPNGDRTYAASLALTLADSAFAREDSPERLAFLHALTHIAPNRLLRRGLAARTRRLDGVGKAFDLRLSDVITGEIVDLENLRGKVVVVDFWAMWCPPCREIVPRLAELYETHRPQGLEIVSVSGDDEGWPVVARYAARRRLREFLKDHPAIWSQCLSVKYHRRWGVDRIPTAFVVDRHGHLRYTDGFVGNSVSDTMERLGNLVIALLDEPRGRTVDGADQ